MKDCGWPGCRKQVDPWRWGCSSHWHMLPAPIQEKIKLGMQRAEDEAHEWIVRTFGAEQKREYDPGKWETLVRIVRGRDEARSRRRAANKENEDGRAVDTT